MLFSGYIVGYLFLAGTGSGAFFVAVCCCALDALQKNRESERVVMWSQIGFILAPCFMIVASLFLLLDLGNASRIWQIMLSPFQSVMSVGAWLVALFTFVSGALAIAGMVWREIPQAFMRVCCVLGIFLAFGVMSYTGLLLADMVGVDFWRTPLLVVLFVVSSLTCGTQALLLANGFLMSPSRGVPRALRHAASLFAFVEACVLALFLATQYGFSESAATSCEMLLVGSLSPVFWGGVCAIGLLMPCLCVIASCILPVRLTTMIGAASALVGGLSLRYCIVNAAAWVPLVLSSVVAL